MMRVTRYALLRQTYFMTGKPSMDNFLMCVVCLVAGGDLVGTAAPVP